MSRITTTLDETQRKLIDSALPLSGATSINSFVAEAALDKARALIEAEKRLYPNEEQAQRFFEALENPPEPNDYLKDALKQYLGSDA
ncbi:DUF1778 domain-containing protein [Zooshikella ganghwensis]|uniref:DUF1778 domain-containing protein n=1 Tax=Zooshikella ganghwensis TaxID=202772 RepID=A0A4P9VFX1_9GAMM|nr:DUF1778 domain-containing protein [Zooshikella ganghwensis]RDH41229.1 DUF1778 domain-containing protein [Zooshikella ganghwensis]